MTGLTIPILSILLIITFILGFISAMVLFIIGKNNQKEKDALNDWHRIKDLED